MAESQKAWHFTWQCPWQTEVSARFPRGFRQVSARFPRGLREVSARFPQGFREVSARFPRGFRKVSARFPRGFREVSARFPRGLREVSARFPLGFREVSARFPRGLNRKCCPKLSDFAGLLVGMSSLPACCPSTLPLIFQLGRHAGGVTKRSAGNFATNFPIGKTCRGPNQEVCRQFCH